MADVRLRFWGLDAGPRSPALSFDLGYSVRAGDWLVEAPVATWVHLPLIGGRFTFPLDRLVAGRAYADWAVGFNGSTWLLIFYCGVEWRLAGPLGVRLQGDILIRPMGLKYTGWDVGPYLEW